MELANVQHPHFEHNSFPPPPLYSNTSYFDSFIRFGADADSTIGGLARGAIPSPKCSSGTYTSPPHVAAILPPPAIAYRSVEPSDILELQALHEALFPIKYEDEFYTSVAYSRGIVSWVAVDAADPDGLVGFVTARVVTAHEVEESEILGYEFGHQDRHLIYILTLGVTKPYRNFGVASKLLWQVIDHASSLVSCRAVYLHVVAYNRAAILFYRKNHFQALRKLPSFYLIAGCHYDAYLYVYYINGGRPPYSTIDLIASTGCFVRNFITTVLGRIFARHEDDDGKGVKRQRLFEFCFSVLAQSHHQRITEGPSNCPPCV